MAIDHYKTLNVESNASEDDLKRAYRQLAIRWHPDKNPSKEAEAKFKQIGEAYKVLGDPERRRSYDLYGEKGLSEQQVAPPSSSKSAEELYRDLVGFSNPSELRKRLFREDDNSAADNSGGSGGVARKRGRDVEKPLVCGLDELYRGVAKKLKITRDDVDSTGRQVTVEEILTIDIKPGWKKGTKVKFQQKGIVGFNQIPSDLVFVIEERPHGIFKREEHNLVVTHNISLLEALTGCTVNLITLDGRNLTITITSVISPSYEEVVPEEGMPITKDATKKGDLIIRFAIEFPSSLTPEQKKGIENVLSLS